MRVFRASLALGALCVLLCAPARVAGQPAPPPRDTTARAPVRDTTVLYYRGYDYGSQALFSPLTVMLNKGFDIFQLSKSTRSPWGFPYRNGFANVLGDAVVHPVAAIERGGGWSTWLRTEIFPLSIGQAGWIVNWTEHFLGGGLTYRGLGEWYRMHGAPAPEVLAALTTLTAAALNEVLEFPDARQVSASSVADLWVFDLGGVLFFTWDGPARWVERNLQVTVWPQMASLTLPNGEIQNNGDYYVLKAPLPWEGKQFMMRFGLGVQFGLTQQVAPEHQFTAAFGLDTRGRVVDERGQESIAMTYGGGLYLDRNNSLLASVTMSAAENRLSVNLYPGLTRGPLRDVGAWMVFPLHSGVRFGIASRYFLGAGIGFGR